MAFTDSNPLPLFNIAQTFFVDPKLTANASLIGLTSINVYFKYKPAANTNQSGVQNPGVTLYLANTIYQVPLIDNNSLTRFARCEYNQILTSSDGSIPTNFQFQTPINVVAGQLYAVILSFDGNEVFETWTAVSGQWLSGTKTVYSGSSTNLVGAYYEYVSNGDAKNNPENAQTQADYLSFWTPVQNTQMTFDVFAARYFIGGVPVAFANLSPTQALIGNVPTTSWAPSTNTFTFFYPMVPTEMIAFNLAQSTVQSFIGAQRVYQNSVSYPGGLANSANVNSSFVTVSCNSSAIVTANTLLPNGASFNWNNVFNNYTGIKFIALSDISGINVRRVLQIANNTVIQLDEPTTFTNSISQFFVTPVGTVDSTISTSPYGKLENILILTNSNANSTVRFVNNTILSITAPVVAANGSNGYSNSDVLYVTGFQNVANKVIGGYVAIGNVVTNSIGGIVNVYMSNLGCGFVNTQNIVAVLANSTNVGNTVSNTSAGHGATFTYNVGATLNTEMTNNIFANCIVSNFNLDDVYPFFNIQNPIGTNYTLNLTGQYFMNTDTAAIGNLVWYATSTPTSYRVALNQINSLVANNPVSFVSFSNEFVTPFSNGAINTQVSSLLGQSNTIVIALATTPPANNDYVATAITSFPTIEFGHYIINNNYFGENTNSGNSWARHITTNINFNQIAEDIRVYLTVYKPINTDFRVFAKIQNTNNDPQTFTNEDWTLLQLISGSGLVSSTTDQTDYVELGYGFQQYPVAGLDLGPNTNVTVFGSVSTTNNSAVITGANTKFSTNATANIVANTLVRLYSPLFSNADYLVASVVTVGSDTSITLDQNVSSNVIIGGNPALIANGLALDIIGYPHQAWNNLNFDNVARYYNSSTQKYDGYTSVQLKIVMLSNAYSYIPQIVNVRALGVTA